METKITRSRNETKKILFSICDRLKIKHKRGGFIFRITEFNKNQMERLIKETDENNIYCQIQPDCLYFNLTFEK